MSLKLLCPGLLTTVQDIGRYGHRKDGIILSGAMDNLAVRIANLLAGNSENAAALEITLNGPKIEFRETLLIAITGADLSPSINGKPVKMWRPVLIRKGSVLAFGKPVQGCRAYLAVSGSFAIPKIMGSFATYLRAGLGGLNGNALQAGDILPVNQPSAIVEALIKQLVKKPVNDGFSQVNWYPSPFFYPVLYPNPIILAMIGPEYEWFDQDARKAFWQTPFRVMPQSDRMGYQLEGPVLGRINNKELLSTAVTFGTVQVPAQGNPIVLMADHQTTGGYPRLAQVITTDFSDLAQVVPGASIRFKEITLPEAQQLLLNQENRMEQLKRILKFKFHH